MNLFGTTFDGQQDYLNHYDGIDSQAVRAIRLEAVKKIEDQRYQAMVAAVSSLPNLETLRHHYSDDVIQIGQRSDLSSEQHKQILSAIDAFIPWKKGPFDLFGEVIDAEWRSDLKWQRVLPHLGSLAGQKVADIGCNNGYFMYRMLPLTPELVVGFEPECRHALNFSFLQTYARAESLTFEPLGIEHIHFYPGFFDTVFCMGILYHHTDPVGLLKKIFQSMAKGGQLIVECQGIPGTDPIALMPESRYAKARGFWWLPTRSCLEHWIRRSGFTNIDCFADLELTGEEQRRSTHAPIDSLEDFLDKNDRSKTIEGYPAPRRFYVKAVRP